MTTAKKLGEKPTFSEPNLLCMQIRWNGSWSDYGSIKTSGDLDTACRKVESEPDGYRIVRCRMGLMVVYGVTDAT